MPRAGREPWQQEAKLTVSGYLESGSPDGHEQRDARRRLSLATHGVRSDGEPTNVTVHNASTTGLLIETDLALTVGEAMTVELPEAGEAVARVVWGSDNLYGCAFDEPLTRAALSAAELRSAVNDATMLGGQGLALPGEDFSTRFKRLRGAAGYTLGQLAAQLGVSKPTVWAWEHGKSRPTEEHLAALAERLGVAPEDLDRDLTIPGLAAMLDRARRDIAAHVGISPDRIRIMIDL